MTNKGRKIHTLLGTCLAAALPCLAIASPPSDVAVGQLDAILNFCARAVPGLEKSTQAWRTALTREASRGARSSPAYKQGYEQISDALAKGNQAQEIATCTAGFTLPKEREDSHGRH
jgi:hypothetical protein